MSINSHKIKCLLNAVEKKPEYAGIVPVFVELYRYLDEAGSDTGITFNIAQEHCKRKDNGFPCISPAEMSVDIALCSTFLLGTINVLKTVGQDGDLELSNLQLVIESGKLNYKQIFSAILERNRAVIDEAAKVSEVPAALLEYLFEIPLKSELEKVALSLKSESFDEWEEAFCPICGSRPGMAEFAGEEGKRFLGCSACNYKWKFKRLQCPYCGNNDPEKLSYFTVGDGVTRIDVCKVCSRYIKTHDSRKDEDYISLDIEDIMTLHLDMLANKEGYERGK